MATGPVFSLSCSFLRKVTSLSRIVTALSRTCDLQVEDFSTATTGLTYINPRVAQELPSQYLAGQPYPATVALMRIEHAYWQMIDVLQPNLARPQDREGMDPSQLIAVTLDEAMRVIDSCQSYGKQWRPMLPRELASFSKAFPAVQLQTQILGLGYLNYSKSEDNYRALVLGGGDTNLLGGQTTRSLFYNLASYNIGPGTFVGIVVKGACPDEASLMRPYDELLARCQP